MVLIQLDPPIICTRITDRREWDFCFCHFLLFETVKRNRVKLLLLNDDTPFDCRFFHLVRLEK